MKRSIFLIACLFCIFQTLNIMSTSVNANPLATFASLSAQADPHTGSANFSVPIQVTAGRAGIQPSLQLQYNSSLPNGIAGVGWNLEIGSIRRSTKLGPPQYDDSDIFILVQNGSGQELVQDVNDSNRFYPRIEDAFLRIERQGSHWEITDKSGTRYLFGQSLSSQEYDSADSSKVFKWCLDEVIDVHGNSMRYSYVHLNNVIYPSLIEYTDHPSLDIHAAVVFEYEGRPENGLKYISGFGAGIHQRLKKIKVEAVGQLQRSYALAYKQSSVTDRSLLDSVTLWDKDEADSLPPLTFSYQEHDVMDSSLYVKEMLQNNTGPGDNLFNIRTNFKDVRGDNSGLVLFPNYNGNQNIGQFSTGETISWSGTQTKANSSQNGVNWTTNSLGRLTVSSNGGDRAFKAWTYLYSATDGKSISLPSSSDIAYTFLGSYNHPYRQNGSWSLRKGYNLLEIVGFNQTSGSVVYNMNTNLASQVDRMHSSQLFAPQIAADFNSDGYTDIARMNSINGEVTVSLSRGGVFLPEEVWFTSAVPTEQMMTGDFNADGRMDLAMFRRSSGNWNIYFSDGTQFSSTSNMYLNNFGANQNVSIADINNDGYADCVAFPKDNSYVRAQVVQNQRGSVFVQYAAGLQSSVLGNQNETPFMGDFNGDGLMDFAVFNKSAGTWRFSLNKTVGSFIFETYQLETAFGKDHNMMIADFNYDGKTDVGYYDSNQGRVFYRPSLWKDLGTIKELPFTSTMQNSGVSVQAADFNGDTLTDFLIHDPVLGDTESFMSQAEAPDLLTEIDNGVGGVTSLSYAPVTYCPNSRLPFPIQVVTEVSVSNSIDAPFVTRNDYQEGVWDVLDREFRGFGRVEVEDPDGNRSVTHYHQDDVLKGRVHIQEGFSSQDLNNPLSRTLFTWEQNSNVYPGNAVAYVTLKRKDNFAFYPSDDSYSRRTAEEFQYDHYGNLTVARQLGRVELYPLDQPSADILGDERRAESDYVYNTSDWILSLPKEARIYDEDNNDELMRRNWFYYDDHFNLDDVPTKGLLTRRVDWAGTSDANDDLQTKYSYDPDFGHLVSTIDAKDNLPTLIEYDGNFKMFPIQTTNARGHFVRSDYFGVNADPESGYQGLWGQLYSTTDPNRKEGRRNYDAFGRAVSTVSPEDTLALPSSSTEYTLSDIYSQVITRQRIAHGQSETIDALACYDGLGRLVLTKSPSETAGEFLVTGQTEYNSRGLPAKKYFNRFTTDHFESIPSDLNFVQLIYDETGRVVETLNPDGTRVSMDYRGWNVISTNENGHKTESDYDAYGRLIEKREYLGADGRSPNYSYESYQLYATTNYEYDSEGNLVRTLDGASPRNITEMEYDKLGRKIRMNDPNMGEWFYKYDKNNNLTEQKDAKEQSIYFEYDELNRLTHKYDGSDLYVVYDYDNDVVSENEKGRLSRVNYGSSDQATFSYDDLGRESTSTKTIDLIDYSVSRDYDALSRLTHIQYPESMGEVFYSYNAAGQIEVVATDQTVLPPDDNDNPDPDPTPNPSGNIQMLVTFDGNNAAQDQTARHNVQWNNGSFLTQSEHRFGTGSVKMDGVDDYLSVANHLDWDFFGGSNGERSIDFWVKMDDIHRDQTFVSHSQDTQSFWRIFVDDNSYVSLEIRKNGNGVVTPLGQRAINAGQWHHIALVKDGVQYRLYVDGSESMVVDNVPNINFDGNLIFGSFDGNVASSVNGYMDQIRFAKGLLFPRAGNQISIPQNEQEYVSTWFLRTNTQWANHHTPVEKFSLLSWVEGWVLGVRNAEASGTGDGLLGEYFWYWELQNKFDERVDASMDMQPHDMPMAGMDDFWYSVRWSGQVKPDVAGNYVFHINANDGFRLYVDGVLRIEKWIDDGSANNDSTQPIYLAANAGVDIVIEYFCTQGGSEFMTLEWESSNAGVSRQVVPTTNLYSSTFPHSGEDTTAPVITSLEVTQVSETTATIHYTTDDPVLATMHYGLTSTYDSHQPAGSEYSTSGDIFVSGLNTDSLYYYSVDFVNESGLASYSTEATFQTQNSNSGNNTGNGLLGEYFWNWELQNKFDERIDSNMNMQPQDMPMVGMDDFWYSVRWSGQIKPDISGDYVFHINANDGFRLYVDGVLRMEKWIDDGSTDSGSTIPITLSAHSGVDIVVEYFCTQGGSEYMNLEWESANAGVARQVIPTASLYSSTAPSGGGDTTAPNISSVEVQNITATSVVVSWITDELATSKVHYGTDSNYGLSEDKGLATSLNHSVLLQNLDSNTTYYFEVESVNEVNLSTISQDSSFITEDIQPPTSNIGDGLLGEYFWNWELQNKFDERVDSNMNMQPQDMPMQGMDDFWYSVRWTGQVKPDVPGDYIFHINANDGFRLYVDGALRIEKWIDDGSANSDSTLPITLSANAGVDIVVEYFCTQGGSEHMTLEWESSNAGVSRQVVPTTNLYSSGDSAGGDDNDPPAGNNPALIVKNVDYTAHGQIARVELGNGVITDYEYDLQTLRLSRIYSYKSGQADVQDLRYSYDSAGNIIKIENILTSKEQIFVYDALNRLASASGWYLNNGDTAQTKTYQYDAVGNIKEKDGKTYHYEQLNSGPHAVTLLTNSSGQGLERFTYDANGNMETRQDMQTMALTQYTYDVENRLIQVVKDDSINTSFEYDGDGGRTRKISANGTTLFIGSLFEKEQDGSRDTTHIFLGSTRVASLTNGNLFFTHTDHLGGTHIITDSDGTIKEETEYQPFGAIAKQVKYGNTDEENAWHYFTGQYRDEDEGLYFYNARYYDAGLGRFLTPDSIVGKAGMPIMLNRYAYVGNNPVMRVDPSGHIFGLIFAAVKAIVSFAVAHPVFAGAIVGGVSGGVSAHNNGGNIWQGIATGSVQGGLAGYTLGLSGSNIAIGSGLNILKTSAAVGLSSQVADAVGEANLAQGLRYGATAISAAYVGLQVGVGVKDWALGKLNVTDLAGNSANLSSGDNIYINGIQSDFVSAKNQAKNFNRLKNTNITKIAHNSSSSFIADMTESFLQKVTFTSSVDRQLANMVRGLNNITLIGHSQGSLIAGNALLNLGFNDVRHSVVNVDFFSTPLSQPRAFISAAIGGTNGNLSYGNNWGDPINLIGPNINPAKFISGATFQFQNH